MLLLLLDDGKMFAYAIGQLRCSLGRAHPGPLDRVRDKYCKLSRPSSVALCILFAAPGSIGSQNSALCDP